MEDGTLIQQNPDGSVEQTNPVPPPLNTTASLSHRRY
jgi:hypothetical protein